LVKLNNIPYKGLFYLGFITVVLFIGLGYWQLTSHYEDKSNLEKLTKTTSTESISLKDIEQLNEFDDVSIDNVTVERSWLLRSRVHNGQSGYNKIDLIKDNQSNYMIVNSGWVPLDFEIVKETIFTASKLSGKLSSYDTQTFGQDDIVNSEYLFRIDKVFLEESTGKNLPKYYLTLTENCGINIECVDITEPYNAPHLSYAFQWLFFAFCLAIVILRKNKLI
jgi:cytochrome oxidase assembly protein ShyY1